MAHFFVLKLTFWEELYVLNMRCRFSCQNLPSKLVLNKDASFVDVASSVHFVGLCSVHTQSGVFATTKKQVT